MNEIHKAAKEYIDKYKFSVIPIRIIINKKTGKNDKRPVIEWKKYQSEIPTVKDINSWWNNGSINQIGIVTGVISNIAVIDIDDITRANQIIDKLIPDSLEIPTVQTPRGGHHLYFRCLDDKLRNDEGTIPGADLRANGGYIVTPPTQGYLWINPINDDLPILPQAYIDYIKSHSNKKNTQSKVDTNLKYFEHGRRDSDLFTIANSLVKDNVSSEFIADTLKRITLSWGEQDDNWIQQKIESALNRNERTHINLIEEIKDYIDSTTGDFNVNELDRELGLISKQQKNHRKIILHRFMKDCIIERIGKRTGNYRKIIRDENIINWQEADINNTYDIKLPFQIHELVNIYPKNIIVIAGVPNSGKTAFLLNILRDNMNSKNVFYFSSEMGEQEFKVRLSKFDNDVTEWSFTAIERGSDYADVIRPDDLNIIDFFEVSDNFYQIGADLTKIHNKLINGIAVIAIQKKKGAEYGRGAEFALEKPRLYITIDPGELKIVKAKNWKDPHKSPNKVIDFKLIQGCEFIQTNLVKPYLNESRQYKD